MSLRYIPQITQTILTRDIFHRLEQIAVTLSSLKIVSLKKAFTLFFQNFRKFVGENDVQRSFFEWTERSY